MTLYRILPLTLACIAIAGCGSDSSERGLAFTALSCPASASNSTISELEAEVINDPHQYRERYLSADLDSQEEPPPVDFETQTVLAVYFGYHTASDGSVEVTKIIESDAAVTVHYIIEKGGDNCSSLAVMGYPYCFVSTGKIDKPVIFTSETKTVDCG